MGLNRLNRTEYARDRTGQTARHGAATCGCNSLVKTCAEHNMDLMAKDADGRTAADVAKGTFYFGRQRFPPRPETEALLRRLMNEANPPVARNSPGPDGVAPVAAVE